MIDITNQRFGKLVVVSKHHQDKRQEWFWECKCDCGKTKIVSGYKLRSGNTKSCGCLQKEVRNAGLHKSHGMSNTRLYTTWLNMKHRCYYKKNAMYYAYGAKGIRVCEDWFDFENFAEWALSHGYADDLTIERIDYTKDYCPENCKWIPINEQYLNRSDSHLVTAFGKTQTIKEWSDETGIKYDTIERRLNAYGWSAEEAVSVKPHEKR